LINVAFVIGAVPGGHGCWSNDSTRLLPRCCTWPASDQSIWQK
jgi:hypothetical protein